MSYTGTYSGAYSGSWLGRLTPAPPLTPNDFDTGLGKPQRTIVREGVLDLLQRLLKANGGYLLALEGTSTVVEGGHDEDGVFLLFDLLEGRAPAIAVAVGDKASRPAGEAYSWFSTLDVHVYVLVNSLRSRLSRVAGDLVSAANVAADPGTEVILEHCEQLLIGQTPGPSNVKVKQLEPVRETLLGSDGKSTELWHQVYSVGLTRSINRKRDLDLELAMIRTYHQLADQPDVPIVLTTDTPVKP